MTSRGEIKRSRGKRLVVWAAAAVAALGLTVIGAEVVVRQFPELMPVQKQLMESAIHSPFTRVVPEPDIGFLAPPGLHRAVQTRDFAVTYETDRLGFSNSEPWPNPVAMVFLGDSLLVGYGVSLSASFPHLIAERLHVGEVNLGLAAAGPERQLAVYRKFGLSLHPQHVIACLYLASDFENDRHFTSWVGQGRTGNYDQIRLQMAQAADDGDRANLRGYAEKSWVYVLVRNLIRRWIPGPHDLPERYRFPDGSEQFLGRESIELAMAKAAPNDPAIEQLMASMEKMKNIVIESGSTLSVVLVPSKEELFGAPQAATTGNLVSRARERLKSAGFAVLDLYPAVLRAGMTKSPFFRVDSHLNEFGHRVVAETFVSWFQRTFPGPAAPASSGRPR